MSSWIILVANWLIHKKISLKRLGQIEYCKSSIIRSVLIFAILEILIFSENVYTQNAKIYLYSMSEFVQTGKNVIEVKLLAIFL